LRPVLRTSEERPPLAVAQVYEGKLAALREKGDPIKLRYDEAATRDGALQALSNAAQHNLSWCGTDDPKYAHIEAGDRETVQKEAASALVWLEAKASAQRALSKADPPAVLTRDIDARRSTLDAVCSPIINKPAPPPPKPEKKAEEPAKADAEAAAGTPAEGAEGAPGAAEGRAEGAAVGTEAMQEDAPAAAEGAVATAASTEGALETMEEP
jgi:heat shock 70kDa protein 4